MFALDPIYGLSPIPPGVNGELLTSFLKNHAGDQRLIAASSSHLPFADQTFTKIYSHMLINNIQLEIQGDTVRLEQPLFQTFMEALRVLPSAERPCSRPIFLRVRGDSAFRPRSGLAGHRV